MSTRDPFVIQKYLGLQGAWFASNGLQMVMYPFLLKAVLDLPGNLIGLATFAMMLPMFLLMIPAGALADRLDGQRILSVTHALAVLPPAILATMLLFDQLTYPVLLLYGFSIGLCGAFSQPARDSLLNRVVQADGGRLNLQRAVAMATVTMFVAQIIGMAIAMSADSIGPEYVIFIQGLMLFSSIWMIALMRLAPKAPPATKWTANGQWHEMREGVVEAFGSPHIMPVIVVAFLIGMFYIGSFQVLLPILVADTYGDESWRMALGPMTFFSGTIVTSMTLIARGGIERAGIALAIAVASGMSTMFLITIFRGAPYVVFLSFIFLWGLGAGVAITMSRSIVQELAPESHRGRLLSIFSTGFMGGAPIGAIIIGPLIEHFGPHNAILIPAVAMLVCLTTLVLVSRLLEVRLVRHVGNTGDDPRGTNVIPAAAEAVSGQKPD